MPKTGKRKARARFLYVVFFSDWALVPLQTAPGEEKLYGRTTTYDFQGAFSSLKKATAHVQQGINFRKDQALIGFPLLVIHELRTTLAQYWIFSTPSKRREGMYRLSRVRVDKAWAAQSAEDAELTVELRRLGWIP